MKYPIGIQNFGEVRRDGYAYVDKTALMYKMISEGKYYFLSRPRRFGKSLLLSTLEAFFQGERELFQGLAVERLETEWVKHPILHLDLNSREYKDESSLAAELNRHLEGWEKKYGDEFKDRELEERFIHVIEKAYEQTGKRVVILVDEYDKPLLQAIGNEALQTAYRNKLKAFYSVLKTLDAKIRFAFLTGVTKFGKVSVFSDLNNLKDISMLPQYSTICGITEQELHDNFDDSVKEVAAFNELTQEECYERLRRDFDGYHFSKYAKEGMYNPFSVLNTLSSQVFNDYWFETGTPSFLVYQLKKTCYPLENMTTEEVSTDTLNSIDIMDENPLPLLYQSGYLTLKSYDKEFDSYILGFPNREVEQGFIKYLLPLNEQMITTERVFSIFSELNKIPRPSHHEERVADYLCQFAERLNLAYERDKENCVVIRKAASKGYEEHEPIVLLNHMDMVCVGMSDPLNTPIEPYTENGWMKARGTSLGADNGIGLSMALAVLEDDRIEHPALEVITTTNEEDGMSGASGLSRDFLKGRKVINLDSEDYDTITTGAAGACLQFHRIPMKREPAPEDRSWYRIRIEGGLGGHSGVDINKGRCSAVTPAMRYLEIANKTEDIVVSSIEIGEANASIASKGEIIVGIGPESSVKNLEKALHEFNEWLRETFGDTDPNIVCSIEACEKQDTIIPIHAISSLLLSLDAIPNGVVKMSEAMPGTVETSNNVGRISTAEDHIFVSTHTRSFIDDDMATLSQQIADAFKKQGAESEVVMSAPAWQENQQSPFLQLVSNTFQDVLGWRPRMVAMHFVLEAGFFVQHYPGIQIASIGPRIVEPHSTSERVELSTIEDIWKVLIELLKRL